MITHRFAGSYLPDLQDFQEVANPPHHTHSTIYKQMHDISCIIQWVIAIQTSDSRFNEKVPSPFELWRDYCDIYITIEWREITTVCETELVCFILLQYWDKQVRITGSPMLILSIRIVFFIYCKITQIKPRGSKNHRGYCNSTANTKDKTN